MSVVQDWVNELPDAAQLELLMAMGSGDFQDYDTVSGLVFKGTSIDSRIFYYWYVLLCEDNSGVVQRRVQGIS